MRFAAGPHEIDYEVRGEGRPLVFVHGVTGSRAALVHACEPVLEARAGFRRYHVDLPGHGASRGDAARASADDLIDALALFVREIPGERAALVAYSYGGYLAQGLLAVLPSLAGAFLLCPVVEPDLARRTAPPQRASVPAAPGDELSFTSDEERQAFGEVACVRSAAVLDAWRRAIFPANQAADRVFVDAARARYVSARPLGFSLHAHAGVVSLVCGRHDHWVGFEDAARLCRTLPDAALTVVPGCGHLLPYEAPAAFRAAFEAWLDRLG